MKVFPASTPAKDVLATDVDGIFLSNGPGDPAAVDYAIQNTRDLLQADGIGTRVVSMPCWELFEEQDETYRERVLGPGTVKVGIEAASPFGWDRYIGPNGAFVGMHSFGASAPAKDLFKHFGITPEAAAEKAKAALKK